MDRIDEYCDATGMVEIRDRCRELYRQSQHHCPRLAVEGARVSACIELASGECNKPFDNCIANRVSASSDRQRKQASTSIRQALGLDISFGLEELAAQICIPEATSAAKLILETFCSTYSKLVTGRQRDFISAENPDIILASFVIACSLFKYRHATASDPRFSSKSVVSYIKLIKEHCQKEIDTFKHKSTARSKAKTQSRATLETGPNADPQTEREEYLAWKENMLKILNG